MNQMKTFDNYRVFKTTCSQAESLLLKQARPVSFPTVPAGYRYGETVSYGKRYRKR